MTDKVKAAAQVLAGLLAGNAAACDNPARAACIAWRLIKELERVEVLDANGQFSQYEKAKTHEE